MRPGSAWLLFGGAMGVLCLSCSSDWDLLDPRVNSGTGGSSTGGGSTTATTGGTPTTTAGGSGGEGGMSGGGGSMATAGGDPMPLTIIYSATVARCTSPITPDPDACELAEGIGLMAVDTSNLDLANEPTHGYVRFDLDDAVSGATVLDATLTVTVKGGPSDQTGELFEVGMFDFTSLQTSVPNQLTMLGADQGPVVIDQVVEWSIPTGLISAGASVYLGILPVSNVGVNYSNDDGAEPPTLTVTYR